MVASLVAPLVVIFKWVMARLWMEVSVARWVLILGGDRNSHTPRSHTNPEQGGNKWNTKNIEETTKSTNPQRNQKPKQTHSKIKKPKQTHNEINKPKHLINAVIAARMLTQNSKTKLPSDSSSSSLSVRLGWDYK
ncbi:hypothetical protein CMV_021613 [Castanea mollissima]|uniref:Uncharacterized protein n=1 Tax=Castanea mollissima TaxID=60419 RepID=A0A8J4QJJ8_9ROSI|nr:hypothetical protein CMV_021613 [Castanea mollissima]